MLLFCRGGGCYCFVEEGVLLFCRGGGAIVL